MGFGRFIHHIGTLLLFVSFVLLIVVDITAPVINNLSMMKVDLGSNAAGADQVTFGTFGYCIRGIRDSDQCTRSRIGYDPANLMNRLDDSEFGDASASTAKGLTRVMVLHPVATILCFIACLLCIFTGTVGAFLASLVSVITFIVTLIAMACDFVTFGIIKRDVNKNGVSRARWGPGIWLILASAIFTLLGAAVVFLTCCCARRKKKSDVQKETGTDTAATGKRRLRRFW
ncbi:Actin cortical patch SUR7/pH-response regulator PalI [Metarhizium album ARSEF 1941]|uniref:Actin cortical patch SUR7/pH-response regulator PalI n=1 Tax=Metarhizium album (strain ARSEF 1941) TaxID=1081103 RepID=A0A0B2X2D1_METAS|nr:Actin cortical patch SUR7/pH-response regulator PalI [Metarhizium album ARSEF 1941]KHN99395.1 Actin cortical patch SUR7/pH-response regulator PalI [Metarhizium album ARSEF 1941]